MSPLNNTEKLEVGFNVPALPGMDEADIQTPCLVVDLDALCLVYPSDAADEEDR